MVLAAMKCPFKASNPKSSAACNDASLHLWQVQMTKGDTNHIYAYMWILLVVMKMGRSTRLQDPIMISSWEKKQRTCCHSAQILGLLCLCSYYFGEFQHGPYGIIFDPAHFHSKIWFRVLVVGHFQAFLGVHPRSLSHNEGGSKGRLYEHKGMI